MLTWPVGRQREGRVRQRGNGHDRGVRVAQHPGRRRWCQPCKGLLAQQLHGPAAAAGAHAAQRGCQRPARAR